MKNMTSKKNMNSNRTPRRIDRNAGGRKKGIIASMMKKYYPIKNEEDYNRMKKKYADPMDKNR
jgi:hypothetical protein